MPTRATSVRKDHFRIFLKDMTREAADGVVAVDAKPAAIAAAPAAVAVVPAAGSVASAALSLLLSESCCRLCWSAGNTLPRCSCGSRANI